MKQRPQFLQPIPLIILSVLLIIGTEYIVDDRLIIPYIVFIAYMFFHFLFYMEKTAKESRKLEVMHQILDEFELLEIFNKCRNFDLDNRDPKTLVEKLDKIDKRHKNYFKKEGAKYGSCQYFVEYIVDNGVMQSITLSDEIFLLPYEIKEKILLAFYED